MNVALLQFNYRGKAQRIKILLPSYLNPNPDQKIQNEIQKRGEENPAVGGLR